MASVSISLVARLHNAFNQPLAQRCLDVTKLIEEASIKEWFSALPLLLESVFGFAGQTGWGLCLLARTRHHEYEHVRTLLAANGAVHRLITRMLAEPYFRFEFPVSCIPFPSQRLIHECGAPPLYADKLQFNPAGKPYAMLSLNAFEYYFFHFTYMLLNTHGDQKATDLWSSAAQSLYPSLMDDYLNHYLPIFPANVSAAPASSTLNWTPPSQTPAFRQQRSSGASGAGVCTPPGRLSPGGGLMRSQNCSPYAHSTATTLEMSEQETWRSRTFLQILIEFWLNQTSLDSNCYLSGPSATSPGDSYRWTAMSDTAQYIALESFLPSMDHVRVVRMLVKHMHYYVNSGARPAIISSPYSPTPLTSRDDEFKRTLLGQIVQKKMYAFLRHCFERWPLDSSFKLVMETWLSFIQPWRYTDPSLTNRDIESKSRHIDQMWRPFIMDNLLFYTVLCRQFIQRSFRVDLSCVKNAYMLYRMSKVFNLPNLRELLQDAEHSVDEPLSHLPPSAGGRGELRGGYSPPAGRALTPLLGLQLAELERPGFLYQPLFRHDTTLVVEQLLSQAVAARGAAARRGRRPAGRYPAGLWGWLTGAAVDYNATTYAAAGSVDDPARVDTHLGQATANLAELFGVDVPLLSDEGQAVGGSDSSDDATAAVTPDVQMTKDGPQLTALGRCQLANGLRKFEISYSGDPDLQPIRSFESAILVRALHSLSCYLNDKFSAQFRVLCARRDLGARVARQFLSCPPSAPSPTLRPPSQRRAALPAPCLRLRWLASYQTIGYVCVLYAVAYIWLGLGLVGFVAAAGALTLLYALVRAVFGGEQGHQ